MERNDGGYAFAQSDIVDGGGMSLRDWFATHAPQPPISYINSTYDNMDINDDYNELMIEAHIKWRWIYADMMLKERKHGTR